MAKKINSYGILLAPFLLVAACAHQNTALMDGDTASAEVAIAEESAAALREAIAFSGRSDKDKLRDAARRPAEVLTFAGIRPGFKVAEIHPGGGYYTRILSRAVGENGAVFGVAAPAAAKAFPDDHETMLAISGDKENYGNVTYVTETLENVEFPAGLDAILMVLYYHDTVWFGADREMVNRKIYEALKPGGIYLVVDHNTAPGAGADVAKELHRVEGVFVKAEVGAAGFEFVESSDLLANSADDHTKIVFDPSIRGKSDRFILKFKKPE